jgi:hypothetical protein
MRYVWLLMLSANSPPPGQESNEYGEWYHSAVVVTEGGGIDTIQVCINGEPEGVPNTMYNDIMELA